MLSCAAPFGSGGLGLHLRQAVEEAARSGGPIRYFCLSPRPNDPCGAAVALTGAEMALRWTPLRCLPGLRAHLWVEAFDRAVAGRLPPMRSLSAFAGQALRSFAAARRLGAERLVLECPTAHVEAVAARYASASARWGIEASWLHAAQRRKTGAEYACADVLAVPSRYAYTSFLEAGVAPHRLRFRRLCVDTAHFQPGPAADGIFRVLYVGGLSVAKGVPVLIEAFARLPGAEAELVLCGGWGSHGMRCYLQRCQARDRRLRLVSGDPLPHYQAASVYVHPSYQDGFGFAPLEAAACGLPLLLSTDTGMREVVEGHGGGLVLPTGDVGALVEALRLLRRDEALRVRMGHAARGAALRWCAAA